MCVVNYRWPPRRAHSSMFQMATCLRHTAACVMSAGWIKKQGQGQRQQGGVSHPLTLRINIELSLRRKRMDKGGMTRGKFQKDINVRRWDLRHHLDQESATVWVFCCLNRWLWCGCSVCQKRAKRWKSVCLSVISPITFDSRVWKLTVSHKCTSGIQNGKREEKRGVRGWVGRLKSWITFLQIELFFYLWYSRS